MDFTQALPLKVRGAAQREPQTMKSPKEAFKILKSFSFCRLLLKLSSVLHNNLLTALVKKVFF